MLVYSVLAFHVSAQKKVSYSDGLTLYNKYNKFGFKSKSGQLIIPAIYDSAFAFSEGVTTVKKNGKWFYIDKKGKVAHKDPMDNRPVYFKMAHPYYHGLADVKYIDDEQENHMTVIDKSGYAAWVDFGADSIGDFDKGYAVLKRDGKYTFLDACQDFLLPDYYDRVDSFSNGYAKVMYDNQWRVLNPFGICIQNCNGFPSTEFNNETDFSTIYFPNNSSLLDELSKKKLNKLADSMILYPSSRYVIAGNGFSTYIGQQKSWEYTNTVISYLVSIQKKNPERFIFNYGGMERPRTVSIRIATEGEDGPTLTPPPFPGWKDCLGR
jgi:hypothetical protein